MRKKILVLGCAALDMRVVCSSRRLSEGLGLGFREICPVFPAVTCVAQATMRTGLEPREHGVICNGRFDRGSCRVEFWGQSAQLIRGRRLWELHPGCRVGELFMQQSLGESGVSYTLSPAPIHKHHGGMLMGCHARPPDLEAELQDAIGAGFDLSSYWGPGAGAASSRWIAHATTEVMRRHSPEILYSYLPHLDYVLQREGPSSVHLDREAGRLAELLEMILACAKATGYEVLIWGDYAITEAKQPVFLNRMLLEHGMFQVREVHGRQYANLYDSRAFAMVDHQVAHLFVRHREDVPLVAGLVSGMVGVESVLSAADAGFSPQDAGELVVTASPGAWFAYPWWREGCHAPDYARHVDIHNKIGFDPCELFWSVPFLSISQDPFKVKGTHGRADVPVAFAVTAGLKSLENMTSLLEVAQTMFTFMDK